MLPFRVEKSIFEVKALSMKKMHFNSIVCFGKFFGIYCLKALSRAVLL
jgi:hypothetical protein